MVGLRAGYALRSFVGRFADQVKAVDASPIDRPAVVALCDRSVEDLLSAEADTDLGVLDPIALLAGEYGEARFAEIVSVEPAFWNGVVSVATMQIQRNVARMYDSQMTETMLRYGFALRSLDEALGIAPFIGA
jgi:hypothetical protein